MGSGSAALGGAKPVGTGTAAGVPSPLAPGDVSDSEPHRIGVVTHYYEHAGACVVSLDAGELRVGDTIHVRGHTTDFYQRVDRLERDHVAIDSARIGEEVGVQVSQRVRSHDVVFRLGKS
jgi:putative protease